MKSEKVPNLIGLHDFLVSENIWQFISNILKSNIRSVECNGKQCYKIDNFTSSSFEYLAGDISIYIDKETGLPVRMTNGTLESPYEIK